MQKEIMFSQEIGEKLDEAKNPGQFWPVYHQKEKRNVQPFRLPYRNDEHPLRMSSHVTDLHLSRLRTSKGKIADFQYIFKLPDILLEALNIPLTD